MNRIQDQAARVAEITFKLLANCQEKEERLAAQFDVSVAEFRTLRLFKNETNLTVKTLVERVGLSGSRLSRILEGLEAKGFVTRSIDRNDRRSVDVTLTNKGLSLAQSLETRYVQIHKEILEGIPEELHASLLAGLEKMLTSLERWLKET